jgi:hypothetical protein
VRTFLSFGGEEFELKTLSQLREEASQSEPSSDPFDDPAFIAFEEEASREAAKDAAMEADAEERNRKIEAEYREAHPGGTCVTCFFVDHYGPVQLVCNLPFQPIGSNVPRIEIDGEDASVQVSLIVPPDFGCNRHVARCHECDGIGGDCDAGDDGRSISWACERCGGCGREAFTAWKSEEKGAA